MGGESVVWEYEVIGLAGRRAHVEAHAVPYRMPDGRPAHMAITRDMTARRLRVAFTIATSVSTEAATSRFTST